ncbi:hypothetical protein SKAU_G00009130 [Synaphobranchus kaupii]|uniref:Uncharacterized protein n=1 Tax=Synaphobranchus kaupii TaxID=118154 RepID=A0A9Q1G9N5_SYNKA|nr:hypothetical protein SKAU_G00009130 [Synaphobranchus kaupii]
MRPADLPISPRGSIGAEGVVPVLEAVTERSPSGSSRPSKPPNRRAGDTERLAMTQAVGLSAPTTISDTCTTPYPGQSGWEEIKSGGLEFAFKPDLIMCVAMSS